MKTIYARFVKALAQMPTALPTVEGHGYRYTPLAHIINAVRPILAKEGLAVYQEVEVSDDTTVEVQRYISRGGVEREVDVASGFVRVKTIVVSEDGEKIESPVLELPIVRMTGNSSAQSIGATITYARRYSLSAFLGIATEEDTDASPNGKAHPVEEPATPKQMEYVKGQAHPDILNRICQEKFGKGLDHLTRQEASILITDLPKLLPPVPAGVVSAFKQMGKAKKDAEKVWKAYLVKYGDEAEAKLLQALTKKEG